MRAETPEPFAAAVPAVPEEREVGPARAVGQLAAVHGPGGEYHLELPSLDEARHAVLDELVAEAQELGMGY